MTSLPCWSVPLVLGSGPVVAWGYSVGVWIMYSMAHEFSWSSRVPNVLGRTSWLVAAMASSVGLCRSHQTTLATVLPLGVVFSAGSAFLCRWTRVHDVVGVPQAPYYGSRHLMRKNILITGANSGIGKETAIQLASMGGTVYFLCRSTKRAQEAVEDILKHHSQTIDREQLKVVTMDLGDLSTIRKAVDNDLKDIEVHVLINNAGLMMGTKTLSKDGHELMMQANHLGHFLLTNLLHSKGMFAKEDVRILNITSSTYQLCNETGFDFEDMMCQSTRKYTLFGQYAQSKLANILFTKELTKKYPEYACFSVHPGLVRTNVTSHMPWIMQTLNQMFAWIVGSMQKIPSQGAYSSVVCAAAPREQLPPSGSHIVNCQTQQLSNVAQSREDAEKLWDVSEKLVGLQTKQK